MTVTYANPDDDNGDPRDQTTSYKIDPSWDNEVTAFVKYIKEDKVVSSGSSLDALKTMELVFKIYASDTDWKNKYNI